MSYVYLMQANQEQMDKMMNFLDTVLRKEGVNALQDVVEIYNVYVQASKMQIAPEETQDSVDPTKPG